MSDYDTPIARCYYTPPTPGLRMLTFPDGTRSGVFGLDEILTAVYAEGRQVSPDTAEEIVERLAEKTTLLPQSGSGIAIF
jgi:hypothetical protein